LLSIPKQINEVIHLDSLEDDDEEEEVELADEDLDEEEELDDDFLRLLDLLRLGAVRGLDTTARFRLAGRREA